MRPKCRFLFQFSFKPPFVMEAGHGLEDGDDAEGKMVICHLLFSTL